MVPGESSVAPRGLSWCATALRMQRGDEPTERARMISIEKIGIVLMIVAAIAIVALLGPASLGALLGALIAIAFMRLSSTRRSE